MVILINGTSSVGKSAIAREIHNTAKEPYLHFCMDAFFEMLCPRFMALGADHLEKRDGEGRLGFYTSNTSAGYRINAGILGEKLDRALPFCIAECARQGLNLVVPTIISTKNLMEIYKEALADFDTFVVYIDCAREEIQRRETARGDRLPGTSLDLLDRFETANDCNLKLDSTNCLPKNLAKEILHKVELWENKQTKPDIATILMTVLNGVMP